ncbi:ABC transporter substrate-binding protein [Rhodococcoides kyotonense]|uniref:Peptide/nickel transport system substrate-binding protein n=1 Tax=Rhodococcoides kyotonense TaxID=398843 RepID=A0A239G8Q2_9NOCA|nr:ABC transporter substrate-binding protein [Rhodococcus kyotonensis]SNS65490.1 peptide/nickel transport system substrate-binding protein [Rhodococcus kyotonensis]
MHFRSRRSSVLRAVSLAAATLIAVSACSGASADPVVSSNERGGDFVYLDAEVTASMQVQVSYWQNSAVKDQMLDRLVYQDPKTFQFVPWIADSWTIDPTGTVYTFVVRDGVSYSNGQQLDAQSVARNLLWFANGDADKGIPRNSIFPNVLSADADNDARTVTVTLDKPDAPFLATLSMNTSGLVADATIDATNEEQSVVTNLIGSGPFVAESEIPAKEIRLVKRRGYDWAPPTADHQGEAYLDSLTIVPVREDSVRVGSLLSGQAHALRYTQPPDEKLLQDNGFTVLGLRNPGLANVLDVRQTADFVDDVRVRKALMYGIDRQEIVDTLYTDNWKVATNVTTEGVQGWTDRSDEVRFDPDESNRLLDDAGFTQRDGDGIRVRDGKPLDLSIYVDVYDHTSKPLYEFVQRQLRRIGVSLTIKQTDFANYPKATTDPKLSLRRNGWPAPDPVRLSVNYDSDRGDLFQLEGNDPVLDDLLRAHITETDPAERESILREAQNRIIDNAYTIPLLADTQIFGVAPDVRGFRNAANSPPFFYDTWIEE